MKWYHTDKAFARDMLLVFVVALCAILGEGLSVLMLAVYAVVAALFAREAMRDHANAVAGWVRALDLVAELHTLLYRDRGPSNTPPNRKYPVEGGRDG